MSFVAAIWLVLLHAVASAAPLPVRALPETARLRVEATSPRRTETAIRGPQAPAEAIRASRDLRTLAVARSGWRVPIGATPAVRHSAHFSLPVAGAITVRVLRVAGGPSHRLASRGSLLPFFPTAPPVPV